MKISFVQTLAIVVMLQSPSMAAAAVVQGLRGVASINNVNRQLPAGGPGGGMTAAEVPIICTSGHPTYDRKDVGGSLHWVWGCSDGSAALPSPNAAFFDAHGIGTVNVRTSGVPQPQVRSYVEPGRFVCFKGAAAYMENSAGDWVWACSDGSPATPPENVVVFRTPPPPAGQKPPIVCGSGDPVYVEKTVADAGVWVWGCDDGSPATADVVVADNVVDTVEVFP